MFCPSLPVLFFFLLFFLFVLLLLFFFFLFFFRLVLASGKLIGKWLSGPLHNYRHTETQNLRFYFGVGTILK